MNIIWKNPTDPKYGELHHGEHEYNPPESKIVSGNGSFPAFVLNGLGLLAAVAAVVLTVAALAGIYVDTAPVSITHNSATLNVSVHNNRDGLPIHYVVTPQSQPGTAFSQGVLESDSTTLELTGLTSKTAYVIDYFAQEDGSPKQLDYSFSFITGSLPETDTPTPPDATVTTSPATVPTEPPTEPTEPPTEPTEPTTEPTEPTTEPTEPTTEPTEPPTEPTEPTTEPTEPPTEPTEPPTEPTEPPTEPTEPPTEPTEPPTEPVVPTALSPEVYSVSYVAPQSGEYAQAYYECVERYRFTDIPDESFTVDLTVDGVSNNSYTTSIDGNTLYVYVDRGIISTDSSSTSSVTVTWAGGASCTSSNTIKPPSLDSADIQVSRDTANNTITFKIVLTVNSGSSSMNCEATLYTEDNPGGIDLTLTRESSSRYTATYTTTDTSAPGQTYSADAIVWGIWGKAGSPSDYSDSPYVYAYCEYDT